VASAGDKGAQIEDVVIARIVKARGIRGEVACDLMTDFPQRFDGMEHITLWMPDDTRHTLEIEDHWFHQARLILKFAGYDTMTAAETLVGGRLVIAEADAIELDTDEFYEYQIVGAEVITTDGQPVGIVKRLLRTGGADVLVIESAQGREHMIPFTDEICTTVDVEAKRITVNPPEGLLEL
jgi:16S rRNA processing protein RimM